MTIATHARRGAHLVRTATLVLAFGLLTCLVALRAFESAYGHDTAHVVTQADTESAELVAAVEQQTALGRTCDTTPVLTDVVLLEPVDAGDVEVATFDEALAASAAGTAWVRRYCR